MNKFWNVLLVQLLFFGCKGQAKEPMASQIPNQKEAVMDSTLSVSTSDTIKQTDKDTSVGMDSAVVKKPIPIPERRVDPKPIQETVSVWSEDQIQFLQSVDKILLFNIHVTEIGSRKLELDSELNKEEHHSFIEALLNGNNYSNTVFEITGEKRKFSPKYQLLLENKDEKLTLMFDVEGLEMMVANLMDRKRYNIKNGIIDHIESVRKK